MKRPERLSEPEKVVRFNQVAIVGTGAIGSLFFSELSQHPSKTELSLLSHRELTQAVLANSELLILATPNHSVQPLVSQMLELRLAEVKLPTLLLIQNGVGVANQVRGALSRSEDPSASLSVVRGSVFSQVTKHDDKLSYNSEKLRIAFAPIGACQEELRKVEALFRDAHFETKVFLDADSLEWTKLLFNTLGSTSVITGLTPQETFSDQALFKLEADAFFERSELLRKSGIEIAQIDWVKTQLLPLLKHVGKFSKVQPLRSVMAQTIGKQRNNQPSAAWKKVLEGGNLDEAIHYHQAFVDLAEACGMMAPKLDLIIIESINKHFSKQVSLDKLTSSERAAFLLLQYTIK